LYECRVMHHRFTPRVNRFSYRIFLLGIDLDELEGLHKRLRLFSVGTRGLYSFREGDYLPIHERLHSSLPVGVGASSEGSDEGGGSARMESEGMPGPLSGAPAGRNSREEAGSLKARVGAYVRSQGADWDEAEGRVLLVTLPRVLGYLFNPVSFYFCYDRSGALVAAIAEVTNTFREMKPYFLGPEHLTGSGFRRRTPKFFYVSPFSDVDVAFDFMLHEPGTRLSVQIDDFAGEERTLTSTVAGSRLPLTDLRLAWFAIKYPMVTLQVIALIHWQALILWIKRAPSFAKASRARDQRELYRPHGLKPAPAHSTTPSTAPSIL